MLPRYEHEAYCEIKKNFPPEGSTIEYAGKTVTLTEINILKMVASLRTRDEITIQVPLEDFPGVAKQAKVEENTTKENTVLKEH